MGDERLSRANSPRLDPRVMVPPLHHAYRASATGATWWMREPGSPKLHQYVVLRAAQPGVLRLAMRTFVVVLLLALVLPLAAAAQGGSTEQPPLVGYTRCGINFAGEDTWEIVTDTSGANLAVWSRGGLSCQAARRNAKRVRFNRSGAPVLAGYRCRSLRRALEYEVDRCIKRDGSGRGFRMAGGA
jgi:hypothetical protein